MARTKIDASLLGTLSGNLPFDTTHGIVGCDGTTNAAAGNVGEVISASTIRSSGISLTTVTAVNIGTISLTPGDWDVRCYGGVKTGGATSITGLELSLSTTSGALSSGDTEAVPDAAGQMRTSVQLASSPVLPGTGNDYPIPGFVTRVKVTATTSYYCVLQASFSASTLIGYGSVVARRVR